jgi:hypothetical protein
MYVKISLGKNGYVVSAYGNWDLSSPWAFEHSCIGGTIEACLNQWDKKLSIKKDD